jgi:riboflavin biosynthesis pyrimidine reductase
VLLGDIGRPAVAGLPIGTLAVAPRWQLAHVEQLDDDVVLTCRRPAAPAAPEVAAAAAGGIGA